MNLFLCTWKCPENLIPTALSELRRMVNVYPRLDPNTIWHTQQGQNAFAASMHIAQQAAEPRVYATQRPEDGEVILYDGCIVSRSGSIEGHDANMLGSHWDELHDDCEGHYVAMRLTSGGTRLEIVTDPIGVYQVYYLRMRDAWLVSNSVELLRRIADINQLDLAGISQFISIGWVGGHHTLLNDVHVIPGGEHWLWSSDKHDPVRELYFARDTLANQRQRRLPPREVRNLAEQMGHYCGDLSQRLGRLQCYLTGGLDSRTIAAVLIAGKIEAEYITDGAEDSADIVISREISQRYGLAHRVMIRSSEDFIRKWHRYSDLLVQQNDGMASLWQLSNLSVPVDHTAVGLAGWGGEMARAHFSAPYMFWRKESVDCIQQALVGMAKDHGGLIRKEAVRLAQSHVKRFVDEVASEGFKPLDIPDVYYAFERVRRWGGVMARTVMPEMDVFSPFCTRSFIQAVFSIPALNRFAAQIHFQLLQHLEPTLNDLPFEKTGPFSNPWRALLDRACRRALARVKSRAPFRSTKTRYSPNYNRSAWLEARLSDVRQRCLDQSQSSLWDLVDRRAFEDVTSPRSDARKRRRHLAGIFQVATVFHYADPVKA